MSPELERVPRDPPIPTPIRIPAGQSGKAERWGTTLSGREAGAPPSSRVCRKCGERKPMKSFVANGKCLHGRAHTCYVCHEDRPATLAYRIARYRSYQDRKAAVPRFPHIRVLEDWSGDPEND